MYAGTARRRRDLDEGFSLVEVLAATVILFFVATALLGLAGTTTITAEKSRERNIVVNAVNSYMEWVRSLDYDDIGLTDADAGEPTGQLSEETTVTPEGVTVTFTPTVEWVDDPNIVGSQDYKLLRVSATAVLPSGETVSFSTETQIRNTGIDWGWSSGETSSSPGGGGDSISEPTIEFKSGSPDEGSDVRGTAVYVGALASTPMENARLISGTFYAGAQPLRNAAGEQAQFLIDAPSANLDFYWDTTAVYPDSGEPIFPDGLYDLKIEVWDNLGQNAFLIRRVLVDNYPPPTPGAVWVNWARDDVVNVGWDVVYDGGDPAPAYFVGVDEDLGTGSWVHTHDRCGDYVQNVEYDIPVYLNSTAYDPFNGDPVLEPFRRFRVRLYAQSPNYMSSYSVSDPFYSPPPLSGEWTITRYTHGNVATHERNVTLMWASPQFPVDVIAYRVWRSTHSDMSGATLVYQTTDMYDTYYNESETVETNKKTYYSFPQYFYRVEAEFIPTGPTTDGSADTVWSNIVGPSGANAGSGQLAETW